MEQLTKKPRLVFFQWNHRGLPKFLKLHMQLHVKCLSEFFDLVLINDDCDYDEICDYYQPDLALFEGGYKSSISKRLKISNISTHYNIPKLGLHNGDGWCECRVSFFSDMDRLGIDTFFSISITTAEHTPEAADRFFVWPNFIDSDLFHDYKLQKNLPVLITGSTISLYPWRQKISKVLSENFSTHVMPHLGYDSKAFSMDYGERYAQLINSSWFVPSCGTVAKEIVRKHFEVPGAKSCLITENSPLVELAGFSDMENCVIAGENDIVDKLDFLFGNTDRLQEIINNGYKLVHSYHTLKQRNQILQWYVLNKHLKYNEKIVQTNPFQSLKVVHKLSNFKNISLCTKGLHLYHLEEGDRRLALGQYIEAEVSYFKSLGYIGWMSEPKLKLAICNLYSGKPKNALRWIMQPIQNQLGQYGAVEPDPVEWAYYIIVLLCLGKLKHATLRAYQFPSLVGTELNRVRLVVKYLNQNADWHTNLNCSSKKRYSIHRLPQLSLEEWLRNLSVMLNACHQTLYSKKLSMMISGNRVELSLIQDSKLINMSNIINKTTLIQLALLNYLNDLFKKLSIPNLGSGLPAISLIDFIIRICKIFKFSYSYFALVKSISNNNLLTNFFKKEIH